jgi:hypothetical protein
MSNVRLHEKEAIGKRYKFKGPRQTIEAYRWQSVEDVGSSKGYCPVPKIFALPKLSHAPKLSGFGSPVSMAVIIFMCIPTFQN